MGRLYVVPTPIGNLGDITIRALDVLRASSLVLAEDTRHTRILFQRYSIESRLLSYHQHNKLARIDTVLEVLRTSDVALVSDGGTPSVSDPGFELIRAAVDAGLPVDVLPGASAAITAVVAAALPAPGFLVLGFAPRGTGDRNRALEAVASLPFTLVYFESPHRLATMLRAALTVLGDRPAVVAREMTKLHGEYVRGTLSSLIKHFGEGAVRGEVTVVIAGAPPAEPDVAQARIELARRRADGEDRRSAIAAVGAAHGVGRNVLYRAWEESAAEGERHE